jgi:ADP-dependent NAD(P)H-hydrate dehydratase / NAD(P)H-hydrate epimerase
MKVFTSSQVREIDRMTIQKEPITSIRLMERASMRFTNWFTDRFDNSQHVVVFAGTGNNGGDALAISRMLIERNYRLKVFLVTSGASLSDDCAINLEKLKVYTEPVILDSESIKNLPGIKKTEIVIDGIFGSGLNRPVEGISALVIRHINENSGNIVSIDIPSGLLGEDNRNNNSENIIKASWTVSFEFPFLSFFMSENEKFVGELNILLIGLHRDTIEKIESHYSVLQAETISKILIPRKKFSHKGTYGHALVISGRYGMMGASVLSTKACIRGGAGLTTAFIPRSGCDIIQVAVPEALVQMDESNEIFSKLPDLSGFQSIACGPAIGQSHETVEALHELILKATVPLVLDADALNILSEHKDWLEYLPAGSVLTPHPKEFDRLVGVSADSFSRHLKQLDFSKRFEVILILKGANTIISSPDGNSYINTTGNPGMATGGMGDVLTGLLVSLIAQGYNSLNASLIAVFIHGLAADIALNSTSLEALIAGDVIENIGNAFRMVKGKG